MKMKICLSSISLFSACTDYPSRYSNYSLPCIFLSMIPYYLFSETFSVFWLPLTSSGTILPAYYRKICIKWCSCSAVDFLHQFKTKTDLLNASLIEKQRKNLTWMFCLFIQQEISRNSVFYMFAVTTMKQKYRTVSRMTCRILIETLMWKCKMIWQCQQIQWPLLIINSRRQIISDIHQMLCHFNTDIVVVKFQCGECLYWNIIVVI
jgi:hypothetical protein